MNIFIFSRWSFRVIQQYTLEGMYLIGLSSVICTTLQGIDVIFLVLYTPMSKG
jgi:hypothetical protein